MAISAGLGTIIGAGIQGGSSVLGGYLSNMYSKKAAKRSYRYTRKLLSNQTQWKVADAKKAGIHPLYALGASTTGFQAPISGGMDPGQGIAEAGQAIGGAISRYPGREEKQEQILRNKLLTAQIGESDARKNAIQAETQRTLQQMRSQAAGSDLQLGVMDETLPLRSPTTPDEIYEYNQPWQRPGVPQFRSGTKQFGDLPGAGLVDVTPTQQKTHKRGQPGIGAGQHYSMREFRLPGGLPILLPDSDTYGEALE